MKKLMVMVMMVMTMALTTVTTKAEAIHVDETRLDFLNDLFKAGQNEESEKALKLTYEIFHNKEVVKKTGEYVVTQELMDDLREYARTTLSDATENGETWKMTDDYNLFLSHKDRNFYLIDNETKMSVRIQNTSVESESNADTNKTYNNPCSCWGEQTLIISNGKLTIWKLGEKLTEIELPGNGYVLETDNFEKKVYFRVDKTVYVWDSCKNADDINVICEDYSSTLNSYGFYGATFFYINTEGYVSMVSLVDGENVTISEKAIGIMIDSAESGRILAIAVDGEYTTIPCYFNKDGKLTFKTE